MFKSTFKPELIISHAGRGNARAVPSSKKVGIYPKSVTLTRAAPSRPRPWHQGQGQGQGQNRTNKAYNADITLIRVQVNK